MEDLLLDLDLMYLKLSIKPSNACQQMPGVLQAPVPSRAHNKQQAGQGTALTSQRRNPTCPSMPARWLARTLGERSHCRSMAGLQDPASWQGRTSARRTKHAAAAH